MFFRIFPLLAGFLLSVNTMAAIWQPLKLIIVRMAAIEIDNRQARNMDDIQSLGVIYINHNFATESEARQALKEETDARGATYYHPILLREPGSNGNMHASAEIYR
ncbi:Putative outer membrane protein [Salmonella enterica subsp. enterica serovar Gaminara str. A4-567]|nr:Putative outer membrane protein [Salmonella enterica subsp. enterica serovar Gaminara str. A4-567]